VGAVFYLTIADSTGRLLLEASIHFGPALQRNKYSILRVTTGVAFMRPALVIRCRFHLMKSVLMGGGSPQGEGEMILEVLV
jgi:hypothetical protein